MPVSPFATTSLHTAAQRRQVYELIDIMSPREVPLLKLVGIDGEAGKNPKFEWLEDTLLAEVSTVANNPLAQAGTTLNVASGDGINFQANMILKLEDEYVYVSAVAADALTITRGVAGSSDVAHVLGVEVNIVGLAQNENADAPAKGTTELVIPYNYFQAFDTSYKISYMAANTDIYGVPEGDDARELEKAFQEVTIKLERTAIHGPRAAAASPVPRLMGGLDWFLSASYGTNHYSAALSSAQLTEKDINDALQNRYYAVGAQNMAKTMIVGSWNKRRINDIYAPYARMERNERTGGVLVDTIDTDWGPIDVVMSLRCPKATVYFVNLDYITIHPYEGLAFFDEEKASSGAYTVREIYGVYSMAVRNTKAMGKITGTAIS